MPVRRSILVSASEDRLQKLIAERLEPGADKESIDRRLWDLFGEEWCIMTTDLMGFSRSVARFGIIHYLQTLYESERLLVPIVEQYDDIMLKMEGDSFLVIFRNVRKAFSPQSACRGSSSFITRKRLRRNRFCSGSEWDTAGSSASATRTSSGSR